MDTNRDTVRTGSDTSGLRAEKAPTQEEEAAEFLFVGGLDDGKRLCVPAGLKVVKRTTLFLTKDKPLVEADKDGSVTQLYEKVRFVAGRHDFFFYVLYGLTPEATMTLLLKNYNPSR